MSFGNLASPSSPDIEGVNTLDQYLTHKLEVLLKSHPLMGAATNNGAFINEITRVIQIKLYKQGDVVIKEGDPAKAMFFVIKGSIQIVSEDGEFVVCEMNEGSFFGEIGILFDANRTATVVCKTKCVLAVLKREEFQHTLAGFPEIARIIVNEAQVRYQSS